MPSGISPRLPLTIDDDDGPYRLNKTLVEAIQQNLKNLILTIPGERIMDPLFGVGMKTFLFEFNEDSTYVLIQDKIREQVAKYMPFVDILGINIQGPQPDPLMQDKNFARVSIEYKILPLDVNDILNITEEVDSFKKRKYYG